jgi:uncharacterized protein (TIGR02271 family)
MTQAHESTGLPAQPDRRLKSRSEIRIPVLEESLQVDTRLVDTGRGVRVHKTVAEEERIVDLPLMHEEISVEHVEVGTWVDPADQPAARYEGDTLIVPVFEEVLVVEKRLRLKEELRITRRRQEKHAPQRFVLRSEDVTVERFDEGGGVAEPASQEPHR